MAARQQQRRVVIYSPFLRLATYRPAAYRLNIALIIIGLIILTVQTLPEIEGQPIQRTKLDPLAGEAVSVTVVPLRTFAMQALPQLMPATSLTTLPAPRPDLLIIRRSIRCFVNVAATDRAEFTVTLHAVPAIALHPIQRLRKNPGEGTAVNVTAVPLI